MKPMTAEEVKELILRMVSFPISSDTVSKRLILAYAHAEAGRLKLKHDNYPGCEICGDVGLACKNRDWLAEVLDELGWPKDEPVEQGRK